MQLINAAALALIAFLGYKAFTQGNPAAAASQDVTAAPRVVRKVVRRRVA